MERPRPRPTPPILKMLGFNENRYQDHIRCGETENDNPDGHRQRGGEGVNLATVAKMRKYGCRRQFTLKLDTKTIFGMTSLEITLSTNSDKGVGQYLATDVTKLIKLYWLLDLSPMNPIDSTIVTFLLRSLLPLQALPSLSSNDKIGRHCREACRRRQSLRTQRSPIFREACHYYSNPTLSIFVAILQ